jgi:hypothetical protein
MDKSAMDIMNPVGEWKKNFNGTTGVVEGTDHSQRPV